jgi:hypothetical protein
MAARIHWWRDTLRACRIAIPPLVLALLLVGVVRFVGFMKIYGPGLSVFECVSLARSIGRFESLAAPFLVASVWVALYPLLLGLRAFVRSLDRRRARAPAAPSASAGRVGASATASTTAPSASGARRPEPTT